MQKKYRPNVAAIILTPKYPLETKIFIGQRNDIKGAWQFPQGGIDKGESDEIALRRELKEEIGTNDIKIVAKYPELISYDFPPNLENDKMLPYDGQIQQYFLVKLNSLKDLNINTKIPEFCEYKFIEINEVLKYVNHFKKSVYLKVLKYFRQEGFI